MPAPIPYDQDLRDATHDWTAETLERALRVLDEDDARHMLRAYLATHPREFLLFCWPDRFGRPSSTGKRLDGNLLDPARTALINAYDLGNWRDRPITQRSIEVARGLGKTTIGMFLVLWRALYSLERGIAEIFRTTPKAYQASNTLRTLIPTVNGDLTDYQSRSLGMLFPEARRRGGLGHWWLHTNYGRVPFWFTGFGGDIRGFISEGERPSLVSGDDLDKDEDVRTATNREQRWEKLKAAVMGLGEAGTGFAMVLRGTRVSDDGLTGRAAADPAFDSKTLSVWTSKPTNTDLWGRCRKIWANLSKGDADDRKAAAYEFYLQHQAEMDEGARVTIPDRWSIFDLQILRWNVGERAFATNYENRILPSHARLLPMEVAVRGAWVGNEILWPVVMVDGDPVLAEGGQRVLAADCTAALWLDPRFSKDQEKNDFAAISCVVRTPDLTMIELVTKLARVAPRDQRRLFWQTIDELHDVGLNPRCGYETNGAGEDLWEEHWEAERAERKRAGRPAPAIHGLLSHGSKKNRMGALDKHIENGHLVFCTTDSEVCRQWVELSPDSREHDDAPDATERAIALLDMEIEGEDGFADLLAGVSGDLGRFL